MQLKRVNVDSERFPTANNNLFNPPDLQKTLGLGLSSALVFFVGETGFGKSILLRAIYERYGIHLWEDAER